jgi:ribosomal protein S18 acetylase RimI-like enzyme
VITGTELADATVRARAWQHAAQGAVCDVIRPWTHGTVVRATRYPGYFDFNVVRVEDDPRMSFAALAAFADEALAGLSHRRIDFELVDSAEPLRRRFERNGWLAMRLLWMRHEARARTAPSSRVDVEEVPYDAVADLRVTSHREDFPQLDPFGHRAQSREVAMLRGVRVLAAHDGGLPVGFAELESIGAVAEIAQVYVHPKHRGRGLGTAVTLAAVEAAQDVEDLWICADDEDRPKELYARLGFRPVCRSMQFLRLPGAA